MRLLSLYVADPRLPPPRGPQPDLVHAIHDRYLVEVVEGLGLCPFARHSREHGRVHRPLLWTDTGPVPPETSAGIVLETHQRNPGCEIILLTFVDRPGRFADPKVFESYGADVRAQFQALDGPEYFMVTFHPRSGEDCPVDRPLTKDMFVTLLRRSPDPVIQCVHADVLGRVRVQAQRTAKKRLLESVAQNDPRLRALVENSIQTDSELSAEIARANFEAVATGSGRTRLEALLVDIASERLERYGF